MSSAQKAKRTCSGLAAGLLQHAPIYLPSFTHLKECLQQPAAHGSRHKTCSHLQYRQISQRQQNHCLWVESAALFKCKTSPAATSSVLLQALKRGFQTAHSTCDAQAACFPLNGSVAHLGVTGFGVSCMAATRHHMAPHAMIQDTHVLSDGMTTSRETSCEAAGAPPEPAGQRMPLGGLASWQR